MDVFGPIKEINKLLKEINRLLNKGMLNIYFKITTQKNFVSSSVFGELQLTQILNFQIFCSNLKIRRLAAKLCGFFLLFSFRTELRHFRV